MAPSARQAWRDAALLSGAALAVRAWVACWAAALTKDGTIYARAAEAAAAGDGVGLWLPAYPPLTALLAAVAPGLGLSIEPWGAVVIGAASAPVAGLVYAVALMGWNRRVALVAGALAAASPALSRAGGTLLATGPHAMLVLAALACAGRGLRGGGGLGWAWGAGLAAGLAYSARPEGLGAAIVVAVAAAWALWRPGPGPSRGRLAAGLAIGAAGLAAAMLPVVTHSSVVWEGLQLSRKKRVVAVFAAERIGLDLDAGQGLGAVLGRVPGAAWEALRDCVTGWHVLCAALGVVGLVATWRVGGGDAQRPARRLLALAAGAWLALGAFLKFSLGYLGESHVLVVGACLLPWSAVGLCWLAGVIGRRHALATLTAACAVVLLAKSLTPAAGRRQAEVDLGRSLGVLLPADPLVVSNLPRVSWYAGARARFIPERQGASAGPAQELAFFRGLGAAALICDAVDLEATHPGLLAVLEREGTLLARTPPESGDDYRAYRVGQ